MASQLQHLVLILLAIAGLLDSSNVISLESSLEKLNLWLEQHLFASSEHEKTLSNALKFIVQDLNSAEFSGAEIALERIRELSQFDSCNGTSFGALHSLDKIVGRPIYEQRRMMDRIRPLFKYFGAQLIAKGCDKYLDEQFAEIYESAGELGDKFEIISEKNLVIYDWLNIDPINETFTHNSRWASDTRIWANILRNLAGDDATKPESEEQFLQIWTKFLIEPCAAYTQYFGEIASKTFAASKLSVRQEDDQLRFTDFLDLRPQHLQDVIYRYFVCQTATQNKQVDRADIFEVFTTEWKS